MHRISSNFGTTRSRGTAGYVGPSLFSVNEAALEEDMNEDQPLTAKTLFQDAGQMLTQPDMEGDDDQALSSGQKSPPMQDEDSDDEDTSSPEGTPTKPTDNTMMEEEEEEEEEDQDQVGKCRQGDTHDVTLLPDMISRYSFRPRKDNPLFLR